MRLVIDSNIFVSALDGKDNFHDECYPLLIRLLKGEITAVCPLLVLVEVTCAIRRRTGSESLAKDVLQNMLQWPSVEWVHTTLDMARKAAILGAQIGLRGGDAIVLQAAEEYGIPIVTKDKEMKQRSTDKVQVIDPTEILT